MLKGRELGDAILDALEQNGVTQADAARYFGISKPSVNGWVKTGRISKSNFLKLVLWLKKTPMSFWGNDVMDIIHLQGGASHEMVPENERLSLRVEEPGPAFPYNPDVYPIPHLNGRAKGGAGALTPPHEYIVGSISVATDWIRRRLPQITSLENLGVIEAYGDSMEPKIKSGDLLVVDSGVQRAEINGLYIIGRKNTPELELMVKRLQLTHDGGLIIISDNPAYQPERLTHEEASQVAVMGKVVWIWAGREA